MVHISSVVALLATLAIVPSANAWGNLMHATTANLAWKLMKDTTRQQLVDRGFLKIFGNTFVTSATNATNTPTQIGSIAVWADQHRSGDYAFAYNFHFADNEDDQPKSCSFDYSRDCPNGVCHVGAIANYTSQLECNSGYDAATQTQALEFIVHFMGDITQPLHNCGKLKGANDQKINWQGDSSKNLHGAWDYLIPEKNLNENYGGDLEVYANYVIQKYQDRAAEFTSCTDIHGGINCPTAWAVEANTFDCSVVWTDDVYNSVSKKIDLSTSGYYDNVKDIAEIQVVKAGFRIAKWLDNLMDSCIAQPSPPVPAVGGKYFNKTMIIMLENTDYDEALFNSYLGKELQAQGTLYTGYNAVAHPSQPNYIALISGDTQGVKNDDNVDIDNVKHIGDLLEAKGYTWKNYAENYPGSAGQCSTVDKTADGLYVRKHTPFMSFTSVSKTSKCDNIVEAAQLDIDAKNGALPNLMFFTPNMNDDGHDTNVNVSSAWLKNFLAPKINDPAYADTLFFITYDESESKGAKDNQIYALAIGKGFLGKGQIDTNKYTHYSWLAAIEDNFGLGNLGKNDATATPLKFYVHTSMVPPPPAPNAPPPADTCPYPGDVFCINPLDGAAPEFKYCGRDSLFHYGSCTNGTSAGWGELDNDNKGPAVGGVAGPKNTCFKMGSYNVQCLPPPPTTFGTCQKVGDISCMSDGVSGEFKYCDKVTINGVTANYWRASTCTDAAQAQITPKALGTFGAGQKCYNSGSFKAGASITCSNAPLAVSAPFGFCDPKYPGDAYCVTGAGASPMYTYCDKVGVLQPSTCELPVNGTLQEKFVFGVTGPSAACGPAAKAYQVTCKAPVATTAVLPTCSFKGMRCLDIPGRSPIYAYCDTTTNSTYEASCEDQPTAGALKSFFNSVKNTFASDSVCVQATRDFGNCVPKTTTATSPFGICNYAGDSFCLSTSGRDGLYGTTATTFMYCPKKGANWVAGSCQDSTTPASAIAGVFGTGSVCVPPSVGTTKASCAIPNFPPPTVPTTTSAVPTSTVAPTSTATSTTTTEVVPTSTLTSTTVVVPTTTSVTSVSSTTDVATSTSTDCTTWTISRPTTTTTTTVATSTSTTVVVSTSTTTVATSSSSTTVVVPTTTATSTTAVVSTSTSTSTEVTSATTATTVTTTSTSVVVPTSTSTDVTSATSATASSSSTTVVVPTTSSSASSSTDCSTWTLSTATGTTTQTSTSATTQTTTSATTSATTQTTTSATTQTSTKSGDASSTSTKCDSTTGPVSTSTSSVPTGVPTYSVPDVTSTKSATPTGVPTYSVPDVTSTKSATPTGVPTYSVPDVTSTKSATPTYTKPDTPYTKPSVPPTTSTDKPVVVVPVYSQPAPVASSKKPEGTNIVYNAGQKVAASFVSMAAVVLAMVVLA
ncbi:hypothetical protein HDU97_003670 [Phlyctochytrium planicorne]|nr:hypothetical protein HDU97_003670 [Phlyctochytrium planicorne]